METEEVRDYLHQLNGLFSIDGFLKQDVSAGAIQTYYTQCAWVYGLLLSPAGAVHLALNYDDRFDSKGFGEQPRRVQAEIDRLRCLRRPAARSGNRLRQGLQQRRACQTQLPQVRFTAELT